MSCLIEFGKVEIRVERFNGSPLPPIYLEGREQREWRENRKSRQDGRFIHVVVISSDFPPVLFVRHRAGNEHGSRTRGASSVSLHYEEYQLLEIQRVRERSGVEGVEKSSSSFGVRRNHRHRAVYRRGRHGVGAACGTPPLYKPNS